MIVRPQKRNVARHQQLVQSLKSGDDIITSGGIYGTITSVDSETAQIEVAKGVQLKVALKAIAMKKADPEELDQMSSPVDGTNSNNS